MLKIDGLTYRVGGRDLLDGASATVPDGHRVGIVGPNGAGKTTLLRLIAGDIAPDAGQIETGRHERIGTVAQEAPDGDQTPLQCVMNADAELASLIKAAETASESHDLGEVHARLLDLDGHRAEARAARILAGLGFDEAAQNRPLSSFSGGWKMRVSLACVLFREPEILLLDEPSNHLDLEASLWLESYLSRYPYTLLIVSHDRAFLNKIPTAILHLHGGRLTFYSGGYDRFERTRAEKQARQSALYAKQQEQRRHIQAFVDRFRYKASKARQAQSRLKMLERMEPIAASVEDAGVRFTLPKPDILPPPIITLDEASVGYEADKPILRRMDLRIDMDDRIGLLGANGNGKTTLMRLLADRLPLQDGHMRRSSKLQVGYLAQNQMEELNPNHTGVEEIQALEPMVVEEKIRAHLGAFGFTQIKADTKIANLSGGEKARLALACICRSRPQLLLLDEPTNHLDIDARQALIQALASYEGAVIVVSHDLHLLEMTADRLVLVDGGTVRPFDGDVADYRRMLLDQGKRSADAKPDKAAKASAPKKNDRKSRADARAKIAPLRKAAQDLEVQLDRLTAERAKIDARLADPKTYENGDSLEELNRASADLDRAIEKTEEAWLQAQDALERVAAATELSEGAA